MTSELQRKRRYVAVSVVTDTQTDYRRLIQSSDKISQYLLLHACISWSSADVDTASLKDNLASYIPCSKHLWNYIYYEKLTTFPVAEQYITHIVSKSSIQSVHSLYTFYMHRDEFHSIQWRRNHGCTGCWHTL